MVFQKGNSEGVKFRPKHIPFNLGKCMSEETKKKISNSLKGKINFWKGKKRNKTWNKGIPRTEEEKLAISKGTKLHMTEEVISKIIKNRRSYEGENHLNWKGGYSNYRGHDWKLIRKEILIRYNFKCQGCGKEENLDVHHKIPYRIVKNNEITNLIPLCRSCHMKEEWKTGVFIK